MPAGVAVREQARVAIGELGLELWAPRVRLHLRPPSPISPRLRGGHQGTTCIAVAVQRLLMLFRLSVLPLVSHDASV